MSGPSALPELAPVAALHDPARSPAHPQDPPDEEVPQGAALHLGLQVAPVQGPGHGRGHQVEGCFQHD